MMTTFVIAHGAWGGGWEWTAVASELRERGHEVFTPTLTGLGERGHIRCAGIGLSDHIDDVLAVIEFEQLYDVVLCGHSYGGMVVTGAADRAADRVRLVVYLDAFVPQTGQALFDLLPDDLAAALRASEEDGGIPIPTEFQPPAGALPDDVRTSYIERLSPQPAATFAEPIRLSRAIAGVNRAYVRCTVDDDFAVEAEQAEQDGWLVRESPTPHDLQLFDPAGTAAVLDELARSAGATAPG